MSSDAIGMLVTFSIVGLIVFSIILGIVIIIVNIIKKNKNMKALKASEFKVDHLMKGNPFNVGFDVDHRKVAFVSAKEIKRIPFSDIRSWKHTYNVKTCANGENALIDNVMNFTINDATNPLIKVKIKWHSYGETWMARLSAILNG